MREIEFSIMMRNAQGLERLQALLAEFEQQYAIHVNLQTMDWENGRSELVAIGLYHHGPDVSEIGSTWVSDLGSMNAMLPLTPRQIEALGGAQAFIPALWRAGVLFDDEHIYTVPWMAEPNLLFYRRDMLAQAGLTEAGAFDSLESLERTVQALQAGGHPKPIVLLQPSSHYLLLHNVSGFIWAAGGDLISPDGKRVHFDRPEAIEGMVTCFNLLRSLPAGASVEDADIEHFAGGRAAVTLAGSWIFGPNASEPPNLAGRLGLAVPPVPVFLGLSNLMIWNHSRRPDEAFELVRFLTSAEVQLRHCLPGSMLPTRAALLDSPEINGHPAFSVMARALLTGRHFNCVPLFGLVEERLSRELMIIAAEVLEKPHIAVDQIIAAHIIPLARRLNLTLGH